MDWKPLGQYAYASTGVHAATETEAQAILSPADSSLITSVCICQSHVGPSNDADGQRRPPMSALAPLANRRLQLPVLETTPQPMSINSYMIKSTYLVVYVEKSKQV